MQQEEVQARTCGDEGIDSGRGPGQLEWYRFAHRFVAGHTVLDVGCGLGKGLPILREAATGVEGQDLDPRLALPGVHIVPTSEIGSKAYDVITSIDVIEHVPSPAEFAGELARIARVGFFVTTPNWTASRCQWPYHLREYTPRQLYQLLAPFGKASLFKGAGKGDPVYPVVHPRALFLFNDLRSNPITAFPTRCWNLILPPQYKIHSHLAAWVQVS